MATRVRQALDLLDKPQYSIWQMVLMSFYSARGYIDVAKNWKGFSFRYVTFMITCVMLPLILRLMILFNANINQGIIQPLMELPPLYYHHGQFSIEQPVPYYMYNNKFELIGIVDTSQQLLFTDIVSYPKLAIVVDKNSFSMRPLMHPYFNHVSQEFVSDEFKKKAGEFFRSTLPPTDQGAFNGADFLKKIHVHWIIFAILCTFSFFIVGIAVTTCMSMLFVFASMGRLFAWYVFRFRISYKASYRLCAVSSTPMLALYFSTLAFDVNLLGFGLAYMAVYAVYLSYALIVIKSSSQVMVRV